MSISFPQRTVMRAACLNGRCCKIKTTSSLLLWKLYWEGSFVKQSSHTQDFSLGLIQKASKLLNLKDKLLHWGPLNPTDLQLFLNGSNEQTSPAAPRPEPYSESRDPTGVPAVWKGTTETVLQLSIQRVNRIKYLAQLHMHNMTSRGKTTFQE